MARAETPEYFGNPQLMIRQLQDNMNQDLRSIHGGDREARRIDLDYLERTFEEMAVNHESKAWKHSIGFIGGVLGAMASGFAKGDEVGIFLSAAGGACTEMGRLALTFNEAQSNRLQGLMERLRDELQQDNKDDQEVQHLIREIDQIITQALEKIARAHSSPFSQQ